MAEPQRDALIDTAFGYASLGERIAATVLSGSRTGWLLLLAGFTTLSLLFLYTIMLVFTVGVGVLGLNIPVAWGFPIVNVVWWLGIGHAGTLISAILVQLRQDWRNSVNRFAEAMTIFAAGIAGLFPVLHLGRPWFAYWLVPYPATMEIWPQWRSPLVWDFFAIATYITVSVLFWYTGLVPDLATMRDRAKPRWAKRIYGVLCLGWRGAHSHWRRFRTAYLVMAALATPLVVSVHSVIALDFATTIVPGYHSEMFPPYFVAGAIFSGFAMVLTITIPLRRWLRLEAVITTRHLDIMAKTMLAAGLVVVYAYLVEHFVIWYVGDEYERYMALNRILGPYACAWWGTMAINAGVTQLLWSKRIRTSPAILFCVAIVLNVGMWLERYLIVLSSPHRGYLPAAWDTESGTMIDWLMLLGSLGLFFALLTLLLRWIPAVSIYEVKELLHERREEG
ncbi:MAG: NrfD/PsrC family molybdoenzyme membrane anchor subunit [Wenzhouxiangellaceae bacterium]|nr:NrfD/PsrC family molybdoenzyme membrane anchor subunit [Wenzhouxiangellaceae bacterium]